MFALRSCARSAPRAISQFAAKSTRTQSPLLRSALRTQWKPSNIIKAAAFHTSPARLEAAQGTEALIGKLDYEINHETSLEDSKTSYSPSIQEYIDNSEFELQDIPGQENVSLVRKYGEETITVTFSTADLGDPDLQEQDEDMMEDEQDALTDATGQSGGANTKGAINQGRGQDGNFKVAPEDSIAPSDQPEFDEDVQPDGNYPARLNIKIERPGKGALAFDGVATAGEIAIESLYFFPQADLADPKTAEKDWDRRNLYAGPDFGSLDEDLQLAFEEFLKERGVNERMAIFVPEYIDHKEQQEYVQWLNNVKNFLQ